MLTARRMNQRSIMLVILFCISFLVLVAGAFVKDPIHGFDTAGYLTNGQKLFSWLLQEPDAVKNVQKLFIVPHYIISTAVLTAIHTSLGMGDLGVIVFHSVLFALIVCMMFALWDSIFEFWHDITKRWALFMATAGGMYIVFGLPDGVLWSYAILTEAIFLFWVAAFVFVTVKGFLDNSRLMWALGFFLAIAAPFVRPTGVVLPLLYLFAFAMYSSRSLQSKYWTVCAIAVLLPAAFVFLIIPGLVTMVINGDTAAQKWIPDVLRQGFNQAAFFFKNGIAVEGRVEYDMSSPVSYVEIVKMIVVRLVYFWVPLRIGEPPYSSIHNIVNGVYIAVTWPLLTIGIKRLLGAEMRLKLVALFLLMVAYAYALLHSITLVAFDWRYQLPAMVPYWVFAGCGYYYILGTIYLGSNGAVKTRLISERDG